MPASDSKSAAEWEERGGKHLLRLSGELNAASVAPAWKVLSRSGTGWSVDASGVRSADGSGLALLWALKNEKGASIQGLPAEVEALLAPYESLKKPAGAGDEKPEHAVVTLGKIGEGLVADLRAQVQFVGELTLALLASLANPRSIRWADMWVIAQNAGVNALLVAGMVSFLTGMIMAFQSSVPLRQFGVDIFVVNLVALAMLRELGPIMTAVVFAGRSGSAFAAEIGTMKVNEELNALQTMGLDPVRFLVVPRVIAGFIVTPVLTIYSNLLGILGGFFVMMALGFPFAALWNQLTSAVSIQDVLTGFIKSFVFGILVAGIGCMRGLQTGKGATAVGESTTRAVVSGIFLIVVVDAIFAAIFYVLKW